MKQESFAKNGHQMKNNQMINRAHDDVFMQEEGYVPQAGF